MINCVNAAEKSSKSQRRHQQTGNMQELLYWKAGEDSQMDFMGVRMKSMIVETVKIAF